MSLIGAAWFTLYQALMPAAEARVAALPVERDSHLGGLTSYPKIRTPPTRRERS